MSRRIDEQPRRAAGWAWLVPLAAAAAGVLVALTPARLPVAVREASPVAAMAPWSRKRTHRPTASIPFQASRSSYRVNTRTSFRYGMAASARSLSGSIQSLIAVIR